MEDGEVETKRKQWRRGKRGKGGKWGSYDVPSPPGLNSQIWPLGRRVGACHECNLTKPVTSLAGLMDFCMGRARRSDTADASGRLKIHPTYGLGLRGAGLPEHISDFEKSGWMTFFGPGGPCV